MTKLNGFIDRPRKRYSPRMERLLETARNGKAIVWPRSSLGAQIHTLRKFGLQGHITRVNGRYIVWADKAPRRKAKTKAKKG